MNRGLARLTTMVMAQLIRTELLCAVTCDRLELRMTLQRLQGGTWTK